MDYNDKEKVQGYEIKRSIIFEDNRGFVLAHNPNAPDPYVSWQFNEDGNGVRDYYWGRYGSSLDLATRTYENRVALYHNDTGLSVVGAYKYYSTQRPVDIGTFPKTAENTPAMIGNYDKREDVEQGQFKAWGYLIYDSPLTAKQIYDYELRPSPENHDYVIDKNKQLARADTQAAPKRISEQLAEAAKQAGRDTDAPLKNKDKSHEGR